MSHNHSCNCTHDEVKYCQGCHTVYCRGCNQEWTTKIIYNMYSQYQPYTITYSSVSNVATPVSSGSTTCKHEEV